MQSLGLIELQGAGDGVEHVVRHAGDVTLLQANVPIGAHPGQDGNLLPSEARYPSGPTTRRQPSLCRCDLRPASSQEVPYLGSVVHVARLRATLPRREVGIIPPIATTSREGKTPC